MKKLYTKEETNFIYDNYPQMSIPEIAEKLGRSPNGLNIKISRLNIKVSKTFAGHDYFTIRGFCEELNLDEFFVRTLIKHNVITHHRSGKDNCRVLINISEVEKMKTFFAEHILIKKAGNMLEIQRQITVKWLKSSGINIIQLTPNYHYVKESDVIALVQKFKEHIPFKKFCKAIYYSENAVRDFIKAGVITKWKFRGDSYIHRSELLKFKGNKI
jgi:hypothetical protein